MRAYLLLLWKSPWWTALQEHLLCDMILASSHQQTKTGEQKRCSLTVEKSRGSVNCLFFFAFFTLPSDKGLVWNDIPTLLHSALHLVWQAALAARMVLVSVGHVEWVETCERSFNSSNLSRSADRTRAHLFQHSLAGFNCLVSAECLGEVETLSGSFHYT